MDEDEMVSIAKQHDDRYLISRGDWRNKEGLYHVCAKLVSSGRARWLGIKSHASEGYGEPGPGIELIRHHGHRPQSSGE
jgi:hypothetical protein